MKMALQRWIAFPALLASLLPVVCLAGEYGNETAASARPILADGTTYIDQMMPTSIDAWFVFRLEPNQSYSIDVTNPYGQQVASGAPNNLCYLSGLFEADGTTPIPTTDRSSDPPAPQVEFGSKQGGRVTFIATGIPREATFHITENGGPPPSPVGCAIRVVPTTLASMRWSVNGYNDLIAISNIQGTYDAGGKPSTLSGSILFFNEAGTLVGSNPFTLASNASVQIVKPTGVAIGGAIRGGIRIVHNGAPGALLAQQLWYNPVTNAYIQYPFYPLVHAYARGSQ
jgi:hypothetical protein